MVLWRNKKDISIFRMKKSALSVAMKPACALAQSDHSLHCPWNIASMAIQNMHDADSDQSL